MKQELSGERLVEIFRTAMIVRSTAEYAKTEAERSEKDTLNSLDYLSRGDFLNPGNLPVYSQEQIAKSSVDAHIKKVQAEQISQQSTTQMVDLQRESQQYIGRKVKIIVLDRPAKPIESLWFNQTTGQYSTGVPNTKGVSGNIEQVLIEKNAIMIRTGALSRLVSPGRHYFVSYVINPDNLDPFVNLVF